MRLRALVFGTVGFAVLASLASGCGNSDVVVMTVTTTVTEPAATAQTQVAPTAPPTAADFGGQPACMVYDTGANVRLRARSSNISGVCAALARSMSASGEYWTSLPRAIDPTAGNSQLQLVCRAADPTAKLEVEVLDTGGLTSGAAICSNLVAKGWFDLTGETP